MENRPRFRKGHFAIVAPAGRVAVVEGPWSTISCADFEVNVTIVVEGPSFRILDATAEQTIAERREAKEELDAAAEAAAALEVIADAKARVYYLKTASCPSREPTQPVA